MKPAIFTLFLCTAVASAQPAPAAAPPAAAKTAPALSPQRLARVDQLLKRYVDEGKLAGAVALVLKDGKPVYEKAFGWSDKEANRKMTTNTIFRIASQTKAVTSTAIMALATLRPSPLESASTIRGRSFV